MENAMNESINLSETQLGNQEKKAVIEFCEKLLKLADISIISIILYGSAVRKEYLPGRSDINLLVLVKRIDVAILKSVLDAVTRGRRYGIAPFFLTEENLHLAADVFPVKYLTMKESYNVLWGLDCLEDLEIRREYLRLRCMQEIRNLLLRLRRHYIMGGGRSRSLTEMMSRMVRGFLETLRVALSLNQNGLLLRDEVVNAAAKTFEFDAKIIQNVIALCDRNVSLSGKEAENLYDNFMAVVDKVARITYKMD
jgi:predicted nucleotidyltransferase